MLVCCAEQGCYNDLVIFVRDVRKAGPPSRRERPKSRKLSPAGHLHECSRGIEFDDPCFVDPRSGQYSGDADSDQQV